MSIEQREWEDTFHYVPDEQPSVTMENAWLWATALHNLKQCPDGCIVCEVIETEIALMNWHFFNKTYDEDEMTLAIHRIHLNYGNSLAALQYFCMWCKEEFYAMEGL